MHDAGLVSVSFRNLSCEEVIKAAADAGLRYVEWGSDIHAPCGDLEKQAGIVRLQQEYGITCCSYGTYFRLGVTPIEELSDYIRAAKRLGTDILRLWCGTKQHTECSPQEREFLLDQCRQAANIAREHGVTLCMECHMDTYTQNWAGALELMQTVDSPHFRMYWQPNQKRSVEENILYIRKIREYVRHVHVFQWKGKEKYPLEDGVEEWQKYLKELPGEHMLLLEFMPDGLPETLVREAKTLRKIVDSTC